MKKVRNLFRILCIFTIAVMLTNCQQDTVTEMQQEEALQKTFPFKTSIMSTQEVEANTKLSNQMRSLATLQTSNTAENVYNGTYNFTVHTDVVKFIESTENNSHSYTFPISRDNATGSNLENLVFSYDAITDNYSASLVTYHFSASQRQEFLLTKHVRTPSHISYEPIAVNLSDITGENVLQPCTTNFTVYHITPDTGETFLYSSTDGNIQNTCEHEYDNDPCTAYTVVTTDCGDNSGSSPSSPSSPSTSGGSGNGAPNGNIPPHDDDTDDIVTSPISKEDYLETTNELNDILGEGNWEFGSDSISEDAPIINSPEELEDYMDSLRVSANATESSSEQLQNGNSMTRFQFPAAEILSTANIKVEVVSNLENNDTGQEFEVVGIN